MQDVRFREIEEWCLTFVAERPRLVHGQPVVTQIAEAIHDHLGVVPEVRDDPPVEPPAVLALQRLRQVPVVDRAGRGHPAVVRRLNHVPVEVESCLVGCCASAIGEDARPGDGEVVLVDAECLLEERQVLRVRVALKRSQPERQVDGRNEAVTGDPLEIDGDISVFVISDMTFALLVSVGVPDANALASNGLGSRRAFDLVCGGTAAEDEVIWERATVEDVGTSGDAAELRKQQRSYDHRRELHRKL